MMTVSQYDLFIAEGRDCFVITKAKVGSRYISEIFPNNCHVIPLDINLEFNDTNLPKEKKDIFYRLCDLENNKKKIFILYRNPINRFISGTIEDLIINVAPSNYNEKFYLKKYLKEHSIDVYEFYENLNKDEYDNSFLLNEKYKPFLLDILSDFFFWQISTSPIISHHSSPYMNIYDVLFKSPNINSENIILINIDDKENKLEEIFSKYTSIDKTLQEDASKYRKLISNKKFYPLLREMLDNNIFFNQLAENVCGLDIYFYNEFEHSKNNIKNIK
jgi:hypothetical protein